MPFHARSNGPSVNGNNEVVEILERTLSSINLSRHDDTAKPEEAKSPSLMIRETDREFGVNESSLEII